VTDPEDPKAPEELPEPLDGVAGRGGGGGGGGGDDGLPRLEDLPRAEWPSVLKPLTARDRYRAAHRVTAELFSEAIVLAAELDLVDVPVHAQVVEGAPVPGVDVTPPLRTSPRQVSFRIADKEDARLRRAAGLVGLRPAQLARLLVLRGVDGLLRQYD